MCRWPCSSSSVQHDLGVGSDLLVRGGVHIVAYAKALEKLTGADVGRLLPIPDVSNKKFPEAMKHEAKGLLTIMWKFSPEDYNELDQIWNGPHPEDGSELEFRDQIPEGSPWPDLLGRPVGDRNRLLENIYRL